MIYAIYKIFEDEPNKGYYWGKYTDPIQLAYACCDLCKIVYDLKVVAYSNQSEIKSEIEW